MVGVGESHPPHRVDHESCAPRGYSGRWAAIGQSGMWVKVLRGILRTGLGRTEVSRCDS